MSTPTFVRRAVAAVAGGAVVAGGLMAVAPAPAAHAAPVNAEAQAGAAWLAAQLDENGLFTSGFDAVGSTVDFGLSLVVTQASPQALEQVTTGVESVLETYIGTEVAPNPSKLAKAAALFQATGADLTNVAGVDLLDRLEDNVDAGGKLGTAPAGDVYGQVWAAKVLHQAGSPEAAAATDYLISQKCDGGAWGYESGGCVSVVDGTAYALLALLPQKSDPDVAAAIADGIAWLKTQQRADGGFGDWGVNTSGTTSEGNGSGLAAWALGAAGQTAMSQAAATWVAAHQVVNLPSCGGSPVAGEDGALAYDDQNMTSARTTGITPADRGTWIFTGAQALAGLAYLPSAQPSLPTFVDAGTTATVALQGARPGQQVCVTGLGGAQRLTAPASATFTVPAGTADHVVTLTYLGGSTTTTLKALDAKKLKVKVAAKIKAKKKATIKVKGLAAGESVTVKIGKKAVTGTANANGVAKVKIKVKKKGKAKVKVVGQFPDRKGKAITRVV